MKKILVSLVILFSMYACDDAGLEGDSCSVEALTCEGNKIFWCSGGSWKEAADCDETGGKCEVDGNFASCN